MTGEKSRLLFVDDERNVLQGIRRMLRSKRDEWDMSFAIGGEEALDHLKTAPADVVISDMKMPKMDGAALLTEVQRLYPETIRIVLSGFSETEAVIRTVGPSHQYLAKPCDPDTLMSAIDRALQQRATMKSEAVRNLVTGLRGIPTLPTTVDELLQEIESPNASVGAVAETIASDVAMTAQILKLVNSAYFGLPREVNDPLQAVQMLGLETIKALALVANIFSKFDGEGEVLRDIDRINRRSLKIGALAKAISEAEGFDKAVVQQACCAGVLAHIGSLPLITEWPDRWLNVVKMVDTTDCGMTDAEHHEFATNHAEIGAFLLGLWGFNADIVEAVRYHHTPGDCSVREPNAITAVHVAQYLVRNDQDSYCNGCGLDRDYLADLGLGDRIPDWEETYDNLKHRNLG